MRESGGCFAARDAVGVRQLYYTVVDGVLYVATTLASLIAALPSGHPSTAL